YAPDASGLEGVAIPVWATRTFASSWRIPITSEESPIEVDFHHSRDPNDPDLLGRITNRLPVELRDVTLLYNGKRYAVGTVPAGGFVPIDNLKVGGQGGQIVQWLNDARSFSASGIRAVAPAQLVKNLLFHGPPNQITAANSGWRTLDQSWRLRPIIEASAGPQPKSVFRDEVLMVARTPEQYGPSETVTNSDAAPTRLWLSALPAAGQTARPSLAGFMSQDTYVRVYIPVRR
ncbi:MAG: hypothetical protein ACRD36_13745, partial [Candidatus Acidiferrum sp.]